MFLCVVRTACLLSAFLAVSPLSAQDQNWGRKMFDKTEIKFGSVAKNSDVTFKITLTNIFKEAIQVSSVSTSCGCISWQDKTPITIPSGERQELTIRLDTIRHQGNKHVRAFVSLLEPTRGSTSQVTIPVEGRIRQDVVLQTNNLNFGVVDIGRAMEHRMTVSYNGGRPDWKITDAKVNNPHLTTKVVEKNRSGGTANYEVIVTLDAKAPVGKLRDQMLIVTNEGSDNGYATTVDAQIEPDIVVSDVQLGKLDAGQSKTVTVVVRGKKPFRIQKIDREKQDDVFKVKSSDADQMIHTLSLTCTPSEQDGLFEEVFSLTISGREQPVTFKAKGRVAEHSVTVAKPVIETSAPQP
ncbi:DUF1573 domain-containing protein [Schlesneria sp.]|uniref:DUF1573 domain-containing protein n=1 Tax=Schlesneria sp. TaxID=2762018 RepID=UPI002F256BE6